MYILSNFIKLTNCDINILQPAKGKSCDLAFCPDDSSLQHSKSLRKPSED